MKPSESFAYYCVDRLYSRIVNGGDYSERTVKGLIMDELHAIQKAEHSWAKRVGEAPLEVRTVLHDFRCRILALRPRERNDAELGRIEEQLLTERADPLHYQKSTGKNGQAER